MNLQSPEIKRNLLHRIAHEIRWAATPKSFEFEPYMARLVTRQTKNIVWSGPFRGMQYLNQSYSSMFIPKVLGIYERELHKVVEEIVSGPFQTIFDIGAAEGYYCAGLALRMPHVRVIAYEMSDSAQKLIRELADLNHVGDRVQVRGECTIDELNSALDPSVSTLLLCDAEGAEAFLLDPLRIPALESVHILVEMHDFIVNGLCKVIFGRFRATHEVEQIWEQPRSRSEFPFGNFYTRCFPGYVDYAISDCRPARMSWYWMRPRQSPRA
jgi:hypothetical protein